MPTEFLQAPVVIYEQNLSREIFYLVAVLAGKLDWLIRRLLKNKIEIPPSSDGLSKNWVSCRLPNVGIREI